MKIFKILILLLLCSSQAKALTLSPDAKISVLTCSPGAELYSLFGHTAIRIKDIPNGIDSVYNYGTFDFQTPNFYLKYAKGLLPYHFSVCDYKRFILAYEYEGRGVYEQALRLDSIQKQNLYNRIQKNLKPQNSTYLYNFLYDNCSTRVRDIVSKDIDVTWNTINRNISYWTLLDEYLCRMPWVSWGIHAILGNDTKASTYDYMFLPDYLLYGLDSATVASEHFVERVKTVIPQRVIQQKTPWHLTPDFVFWAIAVLIYLLLYKKNNHKVLFRIIAILLFLGTGLLGVLIVFLGFFTLHPMTFPNWNILWAFPLNLLVVPFLFMKNVPDFVFKYTEKFYFYLLIFAVIAILFFSDIPYSSLAICLIMMMMTKKERYNTTKNTKRITH